MRLQVLLIVYTTFTNMAQDFEEISMKLEAEKVKRKAKKARKRAEKEQLKSVEKAAEPAEKHEEKSAMIGHDYDDDEDDFSASDVLKVCSSSRAWWSVEMRGVAHERGHGNAYTATRYVAWRGFGVRRDTRAA